MDFDVTSIKNRIIGYLQSTVSWATILLFGTNTRLIDAVTEEVHNLAKYDEYLTRETKWTLAQNKTSLIVQSDILRYKPHRKIGAIGTIKVSSSSTFDSIYALNIPVPKYTVFSNDDDIKVSTTIGENLLASESYRELAVVQGTPKTATFIANGDNYETFTISNDSFASAYYEIYVNDVLWTEVNDLRSSSSIDTDYEFNNLLDFTGIKIKMGNDIFGKKLANGDVILIKYIETLGIEGNVLSTGIITTVESTITDIDDEKVELYCTNTVRIDGGLGVEALEDIRTDAPTIFQAGNRASAKEDYKIIAKQHEYVYKITCWGVYEYNLDNNLDLWTFLDNEENVVNLSAITSGGLNLTDAQKSVVITYLNNFKSPTDIVQFTDVEFIYMIFNVQTFVLDRSNPLSTVKAAILANLLTEYDYTTMDFEINVYETNWKSFIEDIIGVDHHTSYIEIYGLYTFESAYQSSFALSLFPVTESTIKIYISTDEETYTLIGTDDGLGEFTEESGYDLVGSTINYETGAILLIVGSGLDETYTDYTIKVIYRIDDDDLEFNKRYQYFRIANSAEQNITIEYIPE
ncbi:hypothetical protein LCGC14_1373470 [marine sediment metagenome]|uniref:Baseplate protein J-like domain-containing protein n=1 Tax=marine sediment metagenome TaxID=412755 RepID=A0A0F9K4Q1_9ZZZZ